MSGFRALGVSQEMRGAIRYAMHVRQDFVLWKSSDTQMLNVVDPEEGMEGMALDAYCSNGFFRGLF
jgi:hypothetical protein